MDPSCKEGFTTMYTCYTQFYTHDGHIKHTIHSQTKMLYTPEKSVDSPEKSVDTLDTIEELLIIGELSYQA